jgi:hypothetical protein
VKKQTLPQDQPSKLKLHAETIRALENPELAEALAGYTRPLKPTLPDGSGCTNGPGCG